MPHFNSSTLEDVVSVLFNVKVSILFYFARAKSNVCLQLCLFICVDKYAPDLCHTLILGGIYLGLDYSQKLSGRPTLCLNKTKLQFKALSNTAGIVKLILKLWKPGLFIKRQSHISLIPVTILFKVHLFPCAYFISIFY